MLYSINYGICTTHTCTCTLTYITVHSIIVLISALDHDAWSSAPQLGTDLFLHDPRSSSGYPNNHVSVDNCHKALVARQSQLSCIHATHGHTQFIYTDWERLPITWSSLLVHNDQARTLYALP